MKLSVHFSFKALPGLTKKYIQFVLWAFLLFVMLMEFFIVKAAIDMVLIARAPAPGAQAQIVRVDFDQYSSIEKRLEDDANFAPQPIKYTSPFGQAPTQ